MKRFYVVLLLSFIFHGALFSQWSSDSLQNTDVIVHSGEQSVPKIAALSDGGCYVAWYDHRGSNYDMYLQRLDANGQKVWADSGLLISNHPQDTWVTDFDLKVDQNDNAILVFNDIRNGSTNGWDVFAYKISPNGDFLWGADGVGLSPATNTEGEMSPKVVVTAAGNYVFAWTRSGDVDVVALQKLGPDGSKLWGTNGIEIAGLQGGDANNPQLVSSTGDSVIVMWKNAVGSYPATKTYLFVQKLTPDGQFAWGSTGVLIYDQGNIPIYYDPVMIADQAGGAFVAWEEQPSSSESYVSVIHVGAAGQLIFPLNGIKASTSNARLHGNPSIDYNVNDQSLFLFWVETNLSQSMYGIYGQKMDASGNRQWTDEGKAFITLNTSQISFVRCALVDSNIFVGYFKGVVANVLDRSVRVFQCDLNGNWNWGPVIVSAASLGSKDDLGMVITPFNQAIFCWKDERNDIGDIFAQNVDNSGNLGSTVSEVNKEFSSGVFSFRLFPAYPNPFNPQTSIHYRLQKAGRVQVLIYTVDGKQVSVLKDAYQPAGDYRLIFDARDLPSGSYFVTLKFNGQRSTQKLVLIR